MTENTNILPDNTDPNKRYFALSCVSKLRSTHYSFGICLIEYDDLPDEFKNSETIQFFYQKPNSINQVILVCLYEESKREMRRRIAVFDHYNSFDEIKNMAETIASSLGIYVTFHDNLTVQSSFQKTTKLNKTNDEIAIKERELFLYSLIEAYDGDVVAPDEQLSIVKEKLLHQAVHSDNVYNAMIGAFIQEYIEENNNLYQFAHEFSKQLLKADLKLSTKYITKLHRTILVEFPFAFKFADFYLRHAFIEVTAATDQSKLLTVASARYVNGKWDGQTFFTSTLSIESHESIEESIKENSKFFYDNNVVHLNDLDTYHEYMKFCLKCIIYLKSAEPDLAPIPGNKCDKKNPSKTRKFYKYNSPFAVIKVGFSFHGRHIHVNETTVRGHFRWQPCGVQLSEVKLIWIDEHTRHYTV